MKKGVIIILVVVTIFSVVIVVGGKSAVRLLKAEGYLKYTVDEAVALAHKKCVQCHSIDKTAKYCMRCGPPFVVVVHNMRTLITKDKEKYRGIEEIRDGEAAAIVQVWNALVGNWEDSWRKQDLEKLLDSDAALIKLANTPVKDREIEVALKGKTAGGSDLTIMKPME